MKLFGSYGIRALFNKELFNTAFGVGKARRLYDDCLEAIRESIDIGVEAN